MNSDLIRYILLYVNELVVDWFLPYTRSLNQNSSPRILFPLISSSAKFIGYLLGTLNCRCFNVYSYFYVNLEHRKGTCSFPLGALAYTRSGDKGNNANIGEYSDVNV